MRGKVLHKKCSVYCVRITPAYAGKSAISIFLCASSGGSPPPMRGKVLHDISCSVVLGITPAYAGKSEIVPCFENGIKDHPRLCGEKVRP